ncbi:MAG: family 10 glycosylhydrolase [Verrucomicrobia bacterium]|nr:family 10 glycosylhydrolase [Verrucomicrobiota bacterium]
MYSKSLLSIFLLGAAVPAFAERNSTNAPAPTVRADFFRAQPSKAGEFRGAWIHSGYGIQGWDWDQTVGVLKSNGFNAIFPNLIWAGVAHYPSKLLPVSPKVKDQGDQIAACLAACRKYGIELHVWKVNYYLLHAPREFMAELRAAGRTQKNRKGEDVNWLCPSHPGNLALERDSMLEVARNYEVDGIHFDYIRYPDREACFCAGCRERFEQNADVKIANWPDDVLTGEHAASFADWRREQITRLVRTVSQEARALKPKLKVSAAVWGGWANARQSIGQDAQAWIDAGYLDFLCPMNYESKDEDFIGWTRKQVAATNRKTPLYIGIGAHKLSGPEQLARQIQLSRELGGDGFVIFQLNEKLATQFLPPLRLGTTATPPDLSN